MSGKNLYLIDATAFCYRAFYALRELSTSYGQPTNAVYGFVTMLQKVLKSHRPEYIAACFDISRQTLRQQKFAQYKIQRPPMPEDLRSQIPLIKDIIAAYGIPCYEKEGYEADDLMATLCTQASRKGFMTTIVSSDKDILQLVDDRVKVFNPYKDEGILYSEEEVRARFEVAPGAIPDLIALMGDTADNIPGVSGIGEKTAIRLIKKFGSVENLILHVHTIEQEKLRESIAQSKEIIALCKDLAVLHRDLDIVFDAHALAYGGPDTKELFKIYKHLELKRFLKSLPAQEEASLPQAPPVSDGKMHERIPASAKELVLSGNAQGEMAFGAGGQVMALEAVGPEAGAMLQDAGVKKVGHDLKSLMRVLADRKGLHVQGLYFDTMIAAYLLNPSRGEYALSDVALDYSQEVFSEDALDLQKAVAVIAALKPRLEQELIDKELISLFRDIEMPLVEVLADMEQHGIKLDVGLLRRLSIQLEKKLAGIIESIYQLSGTEFNINSPKQLREILFERLKLPVVKRSKTGPSTDEEVLHKLASKHALPAMLLEYRQLSKLKNTYIDTLPGMVNPATGMIHASFNQTGTETGRLSSSNPNLQNIPVKTEIGSQIRRAVVASSDARELYSFDYSQIELRILAHLSGDSQLIAAFLADKDVHRITASLIYGIEEKDVDGLMRETAKRVNFGIVYGQTSWGLARDLDIPVDQAQRFIEAYFARYAQVHLYIDAQIAKARKEGFVTTIAGRRRYIPEIQDKNQGIRQFAERKAVNTPIQGSASDLIKLAMIEIHRRLSAQKSKARLVMQIHDELVFDAPKKGAQEFVELVRERMEHVLTLAVPVKVSIKKGANWLDMEEVK